MDFFETIDKRRSIRTFQNKGVDNEIVKKLLSAVSLAPSAGNLQAYKIRLVRDQKTKEELTIASYDQASITEAPIVLVFLADQKQSEAKYEERGAELYAPQDATIAAAYCQLAATALGLGSVWIGGFDPLEVSRILDLGAYELPVAIIPIGYAAESPARTSRRSLDGIMREI
jgi:nitroreductase